MSGNGKGTRKHPIRPKKGRAKRTNGRAGSSNLRAYFTTRDGRRVYAEDYGYRGWPIGG